MRTTPSLHSFLTEMEYPATKDDLLREARRDGLALDDIVALDALAEQGYDAACAVHRALGHVTAQPSRDHHRDLVAA